MEKVLKVNKLVLAVLCMVLLLGMGNVTCLVTQAGNTNATQETILETDQLDENLPETNAQLVTIEEEEVPLAATVHCETHWVILILTLLFAFFQLIFSISRNKRINELKEKMGEENPAV